MLDVADLDGSNGFRAYSSTSLAYSGSAVCGVGDVNGDGYADMLIGADGVEYGSSSGGYLLFGGEYGLAGWSGGGSDEIDIDGLDGTSGIKLTDGNHAGFRVGGMGDVNGDGYDDFIIGEYYTNKDYVVFGGRNGIKGHDAGTTEVSLASLDGEDGFLIISANTKDHRVAIIGDINGDGYADMAVGKPSDNDSTGATYVIFGGTTGVTGWAGGSAFNVSALDGTNGFVLVAVDATDKLGNAVSGAGDVNGDGYDDFIVSATLGDPDGNTNAGEVYVIYGGANGVRSWGAGGQASLDLGSLDDSEGFMLAGIDPSDNCGYFVSSAGDVNGDGFDDLLVAATNADPDGLSNAGESYIIYGGNFTGDVTYVGTDGADSGTGGAGADIMVAGLDDDTLSGGGGADVLKGGADDDLLQVHDDTFVLADGGTGNDTLGIVGTFDLDLTGINRNLATGIEVIDLTGFGANTLSLDFAAVRDVSGAGDTLTVDGDADDAVVLASSPWQDQGESGGYKVYTLDGLTLRVDTDITNVTVAPPQSMADLDGFNGVRLVGVDQQDHSGYSVGAAGDVNGDGFMDYLVGACGGDPSGVNDSGETYLVLGGENGVAGWGSAQSSMSMDALDGSNGLCVAGEADADMSGWSVGAAGDVNGDGYADFIIGVPYAKPGGENSAGSAYVVFGGADGVSGVSGASQFDLANIDGHGFRIDGASMASWVGYNVSSAGDVNGDGYDDMLVSGYWSNDSSYLVFGGEYGVAGWSSAQASLSVAGLDGSNGMTLTGASGSVSELGDVNGDGYDDFIIGERYSDTAYVVLGGEYGVKGLGSATAGLALSSLDGSNGFRVIAEQDVTVSGLGDVNGDGFDDFALGCRAADSDTGSTYVVFGQANWGVEFDATAVDGSDGFRLDGIGQGDNSGCTVDAAGDVNGDGFMDFLVGAYGVDASGDNDVGATYVVFGGEYGVLGWTSAQASMGLDALDGSNGFAITGIDGCDWSGRSVSAAGDVNGDGFDDILVGAQEASPDGNMAAGEAYIVYGGDFTGSTTYIGTTGDDYILGTSGDDVVVTGAGNDEVDLDDGDDVFLAGAGDDTLEGGDGADYLDGGEGIDLYRFNGVEGAVVDLTVTSGEAINDGWGNIDQLVDIENLEGTASGDSLVGNAEANEFWGIDGDDTLAGGKGNDILHGGVGSDVFTFSEKGSGHADAIDFVHGEDQISLDRACFSALQGVAGPLNNTGCFLTGQSLTAVGTYQGGLAALVYTTADNKLYYDDSPGDGMTNATTIATITSGSAPDVTDFVLF